MSTSVVSVTDNKSSRYTRAITTLTMFKVPTVEISAHSRADSSPASDTSALGSSSDCVLSSTSISTLAPIVEQQRPTSVNYHLMITRISVTDNKSSRYTRAITTLTMFKVPTVEISAHSRADSSPASDTSALGSSSDCVLSSTSISTLAPIVEQQRPTSVNYHLMITRSKMGIYKRNAYIVMISDVEPSTIHDAMAIPSWKQAINDKLQTLIQNHT
ncbi:hypothetical protein GOBAR_AA19860 [Gossypium barbadense]|uniref:Uncharacterized protein n=1 Tax=Gossypium barbadense TaxID=3634 RepID=A0A2P5XBU0_GOSBA|nr:hypothetical protein GOBAR_AA19860 [Gossypium barbadense]